MKELARSYIWWPGLDKSLEALVKCCPTCLSKRPMPKKAEIHPWEWPQRPWHRVYIDYAGPVKNRYFLVIIDAHSKWAEIFSTSGPTGAETIYDNVLRVLDFRSPSFLTMVLLLWVVISMLF